MYQGMTNRIIMFLVRKEQDVGLKIFPVEKWNQDSQTWIVTIPTETSSLKQDKDQKSMLRSRSVKTAGTAARTTAAFDVSLLQQPRLHTPRAAPWSK